MAWKSDSLAKVLEDVDRSMIDIKSRAERYKVSLASSVPATTVIDILINFSNSKTFLQAVASTPGLVQYAKDQKNDQTYDVVAEFVTVIAALTACIDWVLANFPTSGGFLLRESWAANGPIDRNFSPAATAGLGTLLDALIASID